MTRRSCEQCTRLKVEATRARNDLGDIRYKLARAQERNEADRITSLLEEVERRRTKILEVEALREMHDAECTVIVPDPEPEPAAPASEPASAIDDDDAPSLRFAPQPWADDALCAQIDPEQWFPEKGGSTREAKRICGRCTVAAECLTYALEHQERFGIWGGMSERERRKLTRPAPTPTSHVTDDVA